MKYLKIQNAGMLDIRLIGQFGTGLKYVLSYLIRNNIDFKIFVGEEEVKVTTETELIRETAFQIISLNGKRTSITCQMGQDWQAWMIIRELWCNALDEGYQQQEVTDEVIGMENMTTFFIQFTPEIKTVLDNWEKYFIHNEIPLFENNHYAIYPNGQALRLYKQGVLIHEGQDVSLFKYDIKDADINELREYKGINSLDILKALAQANSKGIEYFLENIREEHYEGKMNYDWPWVTFGEQWRQTIGNAKVIHPKAVTEIKARGLEIDLTSIVVVPTVVYGALTKQFEGISSLRMADKVNDFYEIISPSLEQRLKEALAILESCDYYIEPELKFIFGVFGDKKVGARINIDEKIILISESMTDKPLFNFVAMLVEENEHYKTGFNDHTREFQQHFIDLFTKKMLDKAEVKL